MRAYLLLFILVVFIFLSGCETAREGKPSSVGLNQVFTPEIRKTTTSSPVTFLLTLKNIASEEAKDISIHLTNLSEWKIENELQNLEELQPNELYKFSWIAYAPWKSGTFMPVVNVFYFMRTNMNIKLRVYDNDYLNTLKEEERNKIRESPALLSTTGSKNTPIQMEINLKQPFVLNRYKETFSFILEVKNVGDGEVYSDTSSYPPLVRNKDFVRFEFRGNGSLQCDFEDGSLVKLLEEKRSIVCRLTLTKDEVENYTDFSFDFTVSYTYLSKATAKVDVVEVA